MSSVPSFKERESQVHTFKILCDELVQLLANEGLHKKGYTDGAPLFEKLPADKKSAVVDHLQFYRDLCFDHLAENIPLRDSKRLTWRALVRLGFVPTSDVLDLIEDDDVVEIYSADQIQIFRNLEFFDFCSYSIEELFCHEWWLLFERSAEDNALLMGVLEKLMATPHPTKIMPGEGFHRVKEALSEERIEFDVQMKHIVSLFKNKSYAGVVCIERGQFVNRQIPDPSPVLF